jgi:hypothetical protein
MTEHIKNTALSVELNTPSAHIIDNYGFGNLSREISENILKDGRVFAHFIEHWICCNYPLQLVSGCKDHDFIDPNNHENIFDEKTFTKGGM